MKKALIIIDMQNDYFAGGKMELVGMDKALKNTLKLIKIAKKINMRYFLYNIFH